MSNLFTTGYDNSSRGCVLEVDLEYPKELQELHSYYPLAPDKLVIKKEMLPEYQLKITDDYNISIDNVKKKFLTSSTMKITRFIKKTCKSI